MELKVGRQDSRGELTCWCNPCGLVFSVKVRRCYDHGEEYEDEDGCHFQTAQKDGSSGASVIYDQSFWEYYVEAVRNFDCK